MSVESQYDKFTELYAEVNLRARPMEAERPIGHATVSGSLRAAD